MSKRFDVVIGNPPYQSEAQGEGTRGEPIYHMFMEAAYEIGDKAVLITPARFLFNAGATPKAWNKRMLADKHLKIAHYEPNSNRLFPRTDIKGGIVITYRDANRKLGPIGTFTPIPELANILNKVHAQTHGSLASIFHPQTKTTVYIDSAQPNERRIRPNYFSKFPDIFTSVNDAQHTIKIIGLNSDNRRIIRFVDASIIDDPNINNYKVFIPKSNGNGELGEVLSTPLIGMPLSGCTGTFLQIGSFSSEMDAEACLKYVKTKFTRALLGVLKVTQDNPARVWKYVPLQDFTGESDIDWSKPIPQIDEQLYNKYNLDKEERDFIESHVKPME